MSLLELFWSFFQIGLFSIGGGYAALPLIREQVVEKHGWLTMTAFTDVVTIAEMTPGPIAINAATFVGTQVGGVVGALVATLGCVFPSCVIVMLLAWVYKKYRSLTLMQGVLSGLRPGVVGLIGAAGASILALALWNGTLFSFSFAALSPVSVCLFAAGLFVLRKWNVNPTLIIFGAGAVGAVLYGLL